MQNSIYCHHCSTKLPYGSAFCLKCGVSLSSLDNIPKKAPPKIEGNTFKPFIANDDDDDDDGESVNTFNVNISQLEVDIVASRSNIETVANLAQGEKINPSEKRDPQYRKNSKKAILEDFQREAGFNTKARPSK